jgi:uncharacterized protein YjiS (DUF1127 family)
MRFEPITLSSARPQFKRALIINGFRLLLTYYSGIKREIRIRRAIQVLNSLDDHLLMDIGVPRQDIEKRPITRYRNSERRRSTQPLE